MMVESNKQTLKSKLKVYEEVKPNKPAGSKKKVGDGVIKTKVASKSAARAKEMTGKSSNTEKKNIITNGNNSESDNNLEEVVLKRRRKITNKPIALFDSSDELFEKSDSEPRSLVIETAVKKNAAIEASGKEKNIAPFLETDRRIKKRVHVVETDNDNDMSFNFSPTEFETSDDHFETKSKRKKRLKKIVSTKK